MRYANLSTREAFNVLRDYHASCEAAAFILACAIDNAEYHSPWFEVTFWNPGGFDIRVLRPETHHTPRDNCLCKIVGTLCSDGIEHFDPLITHIMRYERG